MFDENEAFSKNIEHCSWFYCEKTTKIDTNVIVISIGVDRMSVQVQFSLFIAHSSMNMGRSLRRPTEISVLSKYTHFHRFSPKIASFLRFEENTARFCPQFVRYMTLQREAQVLCYSSSPQCSRFQESKFDEDVDKFFEVLRNSILRTSDIAPSLGQTRVYGSGLSSSDGLMLVMPNISAI